MKNKLEAKGLGCVPQVVERLTSKHKALSSNPTAAAAKIIIIIIIWILIARIN
jgi:hypothetical protein